MPSKEELFKLIPQVDRLMQNEVITDCNIYRHEVASAVRDTLGELRDEIKTSKIDSIPADDVLAQRAVDLAMKRAQYDRDVRRIINATGVILHSNLGRACLSKAAAEAVVEAASSYCTLEYNVEKGERGSRTGGVEKYLSDVTGCEASLIVNNNAAAVLLILSALASDGSVVVSRGELVEIGGGFRVPDIMEQCGCELNEVGTTNKTRIEDYENAISDKTRAILKVHSSNFKIVGFTEAVNIEKLATLSRKHDIPLIEDIGSGALIDVQRYGLNDEPLAKESLKNGADIVSFSGDKLLGGLQCGIIIGNKKLVDTMKKHPLYRAFRVDKITIAALEATLRLYGDPRMAEKEIPVLSMLSASETELEFRAEKLCGKIYAKGGAAEVIKTQSVAGGGAVPGLELNSFAVSPKSKESTDGVEKRLRGLPVPIISRIEDDRVLLDIRTIIDDDFDYIAESLAQISREPQ